MTYLLCALIVALGAVRFFNYFEPNELTNGTKATAGLIWAAAALTPVLNKVFAVIVGTAYVVSTIIALRKIK